MDYLEGEVFAKLLASVNVRRGGGTEGVDLSIFLAQEGGHPHQGPRQGRTTAGPAVAVHRVLDWGRCVRRSVSAG